jgi:hypothetical protein
MIKALKATYSMIDLYGSEVFITQLKQSFKKATFARNIGSSSALVRDDLTVESAIFHQNGQVTINTNIGAIKFF